MLLKVKQFINTKEGILIIPFWEKARFAAESSFSFLLTPSLQKVIRTSCFEGKEKETFFYCDPKENIILFLGMGKKSELSLETVRRVYSQTLQSISKANPHKKKKIAFLLPDITEIPEVKIAQASLEGLVLTDYRFSKYFIKKPINSSIIEEIHLITKKALDLDSLKKTVLLSLSIHRTRDLVNTNASEVTPQFLADYAHQLSKQYPALKTTVLEEKELKKLKMGLILAVGQGAQVPPNLIMIQYFPRPDQLDHTVLIGKGVCYDTGGLNLKIGKSMETMKSDMAGAAAVMSTMEAAALLNIPVNITALIPAVENSIDAKSYKPGDVYISYNQTSVEILNTDAEGRLILADALAYAADTLAPTRMIDIATLTGAAVVALGDQCSALMSADSLLQDQLLKASDATGEKLWPMPLIKEYLEDLKSTVADIANCGNRSAGAIKAALFLQHFVPKKIPWAHIDIAGPAFLNTSHYYHPSQGTGVGVRLLVNFLQSLCSK